MTEQPNAAAYKQIPQCSISTPHGHSSFDDPIICLMRGDGRLTVEHADRLAQERPPYPPPSDDPRERCPGATKWHRPQADDWNRGNRSSTCTWCGEQIERRFADPAWRTDG